MAVPKAYQKLRDEQQQARKEAEERYRKEREESNRRELELYNRLKITLKPYNKEKLDGHNITVEANDKEQKVVFCVDGRPYLTFERQWRSSHCSCEYICDCQNSLEMRVTQHRKRLGDLICYFECSLKEMGNEDKLAHALAKKMDEYPGD